MLEPMSKPEDEQPRAAAARSRGVTLLELMVGLAVLAILGALALPAMGQRMDRQRLAVAAETLAADLTDGRFEAARRGLGMSLSAVPASGGRPWCWTLSTTNGSSPGDCVCAQTRSCGHRSVSGLDHPGVKMTQGRQVLLAADGSALRATAAVFESRQGERLRVDMLALGRSRICSLTAVYGRYPACDG
jgi:type IV fimbrial biogenesis protein FimT